MGGDTPATITASTELTWTTRSTTTPPSVTGHHGYNVSYRYVVDGRTFTGDASQWEGDSREGAHVCYQTADPVQHELRSRAAVCGVPLPFGE